MLGYQIDAKVPANTYSIGLIYIGFRLSGTRQYDGAYPLRNILPSNQYCTTNLPAGTINWGQSSINWQTGDVKGNGSDGTIA